MTKWVLLIFGLLLLVAGACGWYWLSLRVYPKDADLALEPLLQAPISQINGRESLNLSFSAPKSVAWERIRRFFLKPGQTAKVALTITDNTIPSRAEIVVVPVWPFTKDKLVGVGLDEDLRIIAKVAFVLGVVAILVALVRFRAAGESKALAGGFK
jgi:hypothetical protein